jgi:deazaflavin-dependent oxidoreductase (nitroreductase family)
MRVFWQCHRAVFRISRGKLGLWRPKPGRWGALRLTTVGRRSGRERSVMLGYLDDGPNLVTLAMNGWGGPEPAWWLNLQAEPHASAVTRDWRGEVVGRPATGEERDRLWARWQDVDEGLDTYAARRPGETAVVVLEPQTARRLVHPVSDRMNAPRSVLGEGVAAVDDDQLAGDVARCLAAQEGDHGRDLVG